MIFRFKRSEQILLFVYDGRISFPNSSITCKIFEISCDPKLLFKSIYTEKVDNDGEQLILEPFILANHRSQGEGRYDKLIYYFKRQ